MTTMISVVRGGSVVHGQQFSGARDGKVARISALKDAYYIMEDMHGGAAGDINVKRVGKSLVIEQSAHDHAPAFVMIEDFYDTPGQLVGVGPDGDYVAYLASAGHGVIGASDLSDGASSSAVLTAGQPASMPGNFQFVESDASGLSSALVGSAAVARGFALSNDKSQGGDKQQAAPVASAFMRNEQAADTAEGEVAQAAAGLAVQEQGGANPQSDAHAEASTVAEQAPVGSSDAGIAIEAIAAFDADETPVIEKVVDDHGVIQGIIENGGYTDDVYPTIMGKADPGVKVHVYRGKYLQGYAITDANGEWAFTPSSAYASGTHSISVKYEYTNGDTSGYSDPYVITVDRVAPAMPEITGILDDEGRITGAITDQTITDDNRPTISGTAEANAKLVVYDKGREIGSTTVGADGTWSFTPPTPLTDGLHILSYTAVDRAGNTSQQTSVTEFIVDTRAEKVNIFVADDNAGTIQGEIFTGSVTDDSTPTLMGSATAGGIVKIYEGDVLLGQVIADVDGTWQFTPAVLSEGVHTFHATVTLVAKGESDRSKPFNLTVDLTQPGKASIEQVLDDAGAVVGLVERGQSTDDATPTLSGKAEKGSTVHVHDNGNLLGSAVADANGVWSFTPAVPLSDGAHAFTVAAEDAAGNLGEASDSFAITIDTVPATPPTIDSVYDDAGSKIGNISSGETTDDYRPDISGTAEAGSTVIIKDYGFEIGRVQADTEGKWTFTPDANLADGSHRLTAESITTDGKISLPSDRFDFSVVQNGDDHPRELGAGTAKFNTTLVVDTSGSMSHVQMTPLKASLKQLASEYLAAAGGQPITLTMLTMSNITPVKFTFSSVTDAGYAKYIAAVDALIGSGGPSYESALTSAMSSVKADYLAGAGPSQIFILGDAQNALSQATADKWQAMLRDPTGSGVLDSPIQSTPISFLAFPHGYDYSFHWVASGGKAIDMPTPDMLPEILIGSAAGDVVVGNLLDNDVKVIQDGNEYLTQVSFEGGTFRIAPNNTLVMGNVPAHVKGVYDAATGLLTITTQSGSLLVYMHASAGHAAGDYAYKSKLAQLYHGESAREEVFGYMAVDGNGASQSANLYIVLQPSDARDLLKISNLGKDSGTQGDFVTFDGSAGREVSGTLSQFLAVGMKVQVSIDGGATWQDAVTHGKNWTFIDMASHSSSWTLQVRVTDGVTHGTQVLSQDVTLVTGAAAPAITSIPEATGVYTSALAQNGSEMTVALTGTGAKVGDTVHIQWGSSTYDQVLTAINIANGSITLNVPATVTYNTASYNYDFAVTAQIIGQDGAIGAVSKPFDVVGTYSRASVSDTLQLAPVGNVYTGNGLTVTTTGTMAKTAATASSVAGLTISDSLQANATFTLNKPADYISLRLSGADNALGAHIRVYDVHGNLMYEQTVFGGTTGQHLSTFSWTKTGAVDIGSFTVTAMSASVTLDSFSQYVVTHTVDTRDANLIDILAETFHGSAGNDVVSLSQYAQTYFAQATAAVHGGSGTDTLKVIGGSHLLDLTFAGSKISSMEIIDLTGTGHNTLTLNLSDVLRNGGVDLFHIGDKSRVQMMVNGNAGDRVNLSDLLTSNVDHGDWVQKSAVLVGGVTYNAYQHSSLDVELLVASAVTVVVTNSTAVGAVAFAAEPAFGAVSEVLAAADEALFSSQQPAGDRVAVAVTDSGSHHVQGFSSDLHDYRLEAY